MVGRRTSEFCKSHCQVLRLGTCPCLLRLFVRVRDYQRKTNWHIRRDINSGEKLYIRWRNLSIKDSRTTIHGPRVHPCKGTSDCFLRMETSRSYGGCGYQSRPRCPVTQKTELNSYFLVNRFRDGRRSRSRFLRVPPSLLPSSTDSGPRSMSYDLIPNRPTLLSLLIETHQSFFRLYSITHPLVPSR